MSSVRRSPGTDRCRAATPTRTTAPPPRSSCSSTSASWSPSPRRPPRLHHDLAHDHLSGIAGYAMVFFAIWWAWVNYTWFASAYDTDDIVFRLLTFVVMTGVLVLAAGVPRAAGEEHDFWLVVAGYVIMRVAMIPLWLRVAREHPAGRRTALRYAGGDRRDPGAVGLRTVFARRTTRVGWSLRRPRGGGDGRAYWAEHAGWARPGTGTTSRSATSCSRSSCSARSSWPPPRPSRAPSTTTDWSAQLAPHPRRAAAWCSRCGGSTSSGRWSTPCDGRRRSCSATCTASSFASAAAVGACLAMLVDIIEHEAHLATRTAVLAARGVRSSVYLLVISGLHSLADQSFATAIPAGGGGRASGWSALLGLDAGHQRAADRAGAGTQPRRPRTAYEPAAPSTASALESAGPARPRRTAARDTCSTSGTAASGARRRARCCAGALPHQVRLDQEPGPQDDGDDRVERGRCRPPATAASDTATITQE